jgi:diadenosine tetraphosphatase ApaH/serine/threonine PP2A family protein phosphatase
MKYAIISDVHSNIEAFTAVLEKAKALEVEKYLFLGDIVGYNANPRECLELLKTLDTEVVLRGNHDEYVGTDSKLIGFNPEAAQVVEWTRKQVTKQERDWLYSLPYKETIGLKTTVVHATLDMPGRWGYVIDKLHASASFSYQYTPVCFYGHTHVPMVFDKFGSVQQNDFTEVQLEPGHKYMINVGSVGQPRDGDWRAAFAMFDTDERIITLHRVQYDLKTCQKKIRHSGLPDRCADRLADGR